MNASNIDIIKAARRNIVRFGIPGLTLDTLMQEPEIFGKKLPKEISSENGLLKLLHLDFEQEISVLATAVTKYKKAPDEEISLLFKGLYKLFNHNLYYLGLAFDPDVPLKRTKAEDIIFRKISLVKSYLTRWIQRTKTEDVFKIPESILVLVNEILKNFRARINDRQQADKMIKDIQNIQPAKD